ncbi:DoxX family protein [Kribbella sp. VKM Ac-2566]|uniref:DoxX family protein n=1 Tax=Kribbella sp. VKM Ac-2566 TaxID=2512218 RepID=UPI0010E0B7EE|nr:DoxX family protein [Kribbella sp. VKM Ac-2566]TDW98640.1 DoxX-like protein [Kribbella sp. VKM Ac-2566]
MNTTLNVVLWIAQGFLALFFFAGGVPKVVGRGIDRWTGFSDLPRAQVILVGVTEVLAAAGLVLPKATGVLPWLTPLAAIGLAVIGLMAAGFHVRFNEHLNVLETSLLASIGGVIAIGRWDLVDSSAEVAPWTVVIALCLLVPAAVVNVVILYKGGAQQTASAHSSSGQPMEARQPVA